MTPPDPHPHEPPWEALEALAAGELPADEARTLRERIERESGWRDAWRRVEEVEAMLRREPPLPLPLALIQQTLARVLPLEPARPWRALARVAAMVLVFCGSWFVFSGQAPALADAAAPPEAVVALPDVLPSLPMAAEVAGPSGALDAAGWAVAGLVLMLLGAALALRWHRAALDGGAR